MLRRIIVPLLLTTLACRPTTTPAAEVDEPAPGIVADAEARDSCDAHERVGSDWAFRAESKFATKLGTTDAPTRLQIFRVEADACRLHRIDTFPPGWRVIDSDIDRGVVYIRGHDARWAAYASFGTYALDLETGETRPVVERVLAELRCGDGWPRAVVTRSPKRDGEAFEDGIFSLQVVDLPDAEHVANSPDFAGWYSGYGEEAVLRMEQELAWNGDCTSLSYVHGGERRVFERR